MNAQPINGSEPMDELERRLQRIILMVRDDASFSRNILTRIQREKYGPGNVTIIQLRRWLLRGVIGLAAVLLLGFFVHIVANSTRTALAMDVVERKLLSLNSLHFKGVMYPPNGGPARPFEIYARQPDLCRITGCLASCPQTTTSTDLYITPRQIILADQSTKRATSAFTTKADARAQVAQILQGTGQLMVGNFPGFKRLRSDEINGSTFDVYENQMDSHTRVDVWINSKTDLPIRTEMYELEAGKPDRLSLRFDTIEANPPIDDDVFACHLPPGWSIVYAKPSNTANLGLYSCWFGGKRLCIPYLIALDNGEALMCWCMYDGTHPDQDLSDTDVKLSITSTSGATYSARLLHADATTDGYHWRWSILHPDRPSKGSILAISITATANHDTGEMTNIAETLAQGELAAQVEALQKQTLPAGVPPMTLKEIESTDR